ncbi:double-stranded RNA-specific adenosine deaminase [Klebsormidium nitens]|uniref:Double-stranded RNA-specific adenosine deaminase n=1 Tax=Klebsormidium nitens TaxID=105231 RepID=A0A0U9HT58_KLENI|nr:double-stranded RNA-specific adenosine deaminase [Klebsormidium nitens]|eukprot:GAQ90648.1 double-stranded RNA-specific adenosine deaminase [Klebsormidium nitens]
MASWRPVGWDQAQGAGASGLSRSQNEANGALPYHYRQGSLGSWEQTHAGIGAGTVSASPYHLGQPPLSWQAPPAFYPPGGAIHEPVPSHAPQYTVQHPSMVHPASQLAAPPLQQPGGPPAYGQTRRPSPACPHRSPPSSTALAPRSVPNTIAAQQKGVLVSPVAYRAGGAIAPLVKNAISLLNEACQKLKLAAPAYSFSTDQVTARHTATLIVCGQTFTQTGPSKPAAKNAVAEAALNGVPGLRNWVPVAQGGPPAAAVAGAAPKDPMSALNELCQKRGVHAVFSFSEDAGDRWVGPTHTASLAIAGRFFVAGAPRKDVAKKLAARAALESLQGPDAQPAQQRPQVAGKPAQSAAPAVTAQEIAALAQMLPGVGPATAGSATQPQQAGRTPPVTSSAGEGAQNKEGPPEGPSAARVELALTDGSQSRESGTAPAAPQASHLVEPATSPGPALGKRVYASVAGTEKDPVSLLNEYTMRRGAHFEIVVRRLPTVTPAFVAEFAVDGRTFTAEGLSKGEAKKGVADAVLQHLEAQRPGTLEELTRGKAKKARKETAQAEPSPAVQGEGPKKLERERADKKRKLGGRDSQQDDGKTEGAGSNAFAYKLAKVACRKYRQLPASSSAQPGKKVLAAIILELPSPAGEPALRCVALGTGSHSAPQLARDDASLRDCRAEVLAVRAFRRFLCTQLERELHEERRRGRTALETVNPDPVEESDAAANGGDAAAEAGPAVAAEGGGGAMEAVGEAARDSVKSDEEESGSAKEEPLDDVRGGKKAKVEMTEGVSDDQPAEATPDAWALGLESGGPGADTPEPVPEPGAEAEAVRLDNPAEANGQVAGTETGAAEEDSVVCRDESGGRWRLRDGVKVHLWVSRPRAQQAHNGAVEDMERETRQVKVLRWTVVGVQGGLLAHLLPPVYLTSVTVNADAELYRNAGALAGLAERLPEPFTVRQPQVAQAFSCVSGTFRVETGAPMTECGESWAEGDEGLERVRSEDGRLDAPPGGESRLSRRRMFEQVRQLGDAGAGVESAAVTAERDEQPPAARAFESVETAKRAAVQYRAAKEVLAGFLDERRRAETGASVERESVAKPDLAT